MPPPKDVRLELYKAGVQAATRFCRRNSLPLPAFFTYADAAACDGKGVDPTAYRLLQKVRSGALIGTNTGYYTRGHVFVNVQVTAWPVNNPGMRRWSYPCWKTDRTAMGVVAHELGHYCEDVLQQRGVLQHLFHSVQWRRIIRGKRVSSYEPVPSEAWAESMRLFILNPDLLRRALPQRYAFITEEAQLKPSETREYRAVLLKHPEYLRAAKNWIAQ